MIKGIHHVAIGVADLETGIAFYRDAFGFKVLSVGELSNDQAADRCIGLDNCKAGVAMLKAPNAYVELWSYQNPTQKKMTQRPCDYGYPHFALQVTNLDDEYERLKDKGMKFGNIPQSFGETSAIYGEDPFGNIIELYEIRDESTPQL